MATRRKILLVDDEVAILLTLKAVLEISGFQVDTAASAKEAKLKLKKNEYAMVITDMRMESDQAGKDVIRAARSAPYHPAIALLTAFPVAEEDWQEMGADNMLVKPMQIQALLEQVEQLLRSHDARTTGIEDGSPRESVLAATKSTANKASAKKASAKKTVSRTSAKKRSKGQKSKVTATTS